MDENEVLLQTLSSTIQRHARLVQNYETEIANLTATVIKLQSLIQEQNTVVE